MERLDPVRFITNHSTGKMGYAIAENAMLRGASVTLISGRASAAKPPFVNFIQVESAQEMFEAVKENAVQADIIIKSAAVADYRPKNIADNKIKKNADDMLIELERTTDILQYLGQHKQANQFICGFSMETENMVENSKQKREKKNIDMIVANNLKVKGAGFGVDTNEVTLITEKSCVELPLMTKAEVAEKLLTEIIKLKNL